jgi:hypothetical protein
MSRRRARIAKPGEAETSVKEPMDRELNTTPSEEDVDESLRETFPCSDPPSWMAIKRVGSPK